MTMPNGRRVTFYFIPTSYPFPFGFLLQPTHRLSGELAGPLQPKDERARRSKLERASLDQRDLDLGGARLGEQRREAILDGAAGIGASVG